MTPAYQRQEDHPTTPAQHRPGEMKLLLAPFRRASSVPPPAPRPSPSPPPPPPSPCPWLWRCHSCLTIYRLAVTRRCLDCDHTFCLGGADDASAAAPHKGRKRKRRGGGGGGGPCKAEFDYRGWKARGAWRRTVLLNDSSVGRLKTTTRTTTKGQGQQPWGDEYGAAAVLRSSSSSGEDEDGGEEEEEEEAQPRAPSSSPSPFEDRRKRLFLRRRHDCSVHCDFPSECHHALFRARREGRPVLREAEALDVREEEEEEAAVAAVAGGAGRRRWARRLTVAEYKLRLARRRGAAAAAAAPSMGRGADLEAVAEEEEEEEEEGEEEEGEEEEGYGGDGHGSVSPASPTSLEPPREVAVVSHSPGRASAPVAEDNAPADFATTAAPLCLDETYSDDDDDDDDDETESRGQARHKQLDGAEPHGRRHAMALLTTTGERIPGPPPPGPFVTPLDDTPGAPSPPDISSDSAAGAGLDLEAAWAEQAWFGGRQEQQQQHHHHHHHPNPPRPAHTGTPGGGGGDGEDDDEGWDSRSDSSSSSRSRSSSCSCCSSSSASSGAAYSPPAQADAEGDVPMRDDDAALDMRALLRMRNAFMRGDM